MSNIFVRIGQSVFSPKFYSELIPSKQGGFGYLLKLSLLIALVYTIAMGVWFVPVSRVFLDEGGKQIVEAYPQDLVVKFENGEVSTNSDAPYIIPMPADDSGVKPEHANVIVIDTAAEATPEALDTADAFVLVTKTAVAFRQDTQGQVRIQDFKSFGNEKFELSADTVKSWVDSTLPKLKSAAPFLLILVFFWSWMTNFGLFFYALLGALIVLIVGSIKKVSMGYGRAYTATLYLMTLPMLVKLVLSIVAVYGTAPTIPFLFSILLLVAAVLNLKSSAMAPVASAPVAPVTPSTPSVQPPTV
jgi:hypothetical protein